MGVGGQHHALAALPLGKTQYPLYMRLGGNQGHSGRVHKISPPTVFNPDCSESYQLHYPSPFICSTKHKKTTNSNNINNMKNTGYKNIHASNSIT
jgi:hypothetical protein